MLCLSLVPEFSLSQHVHLPICYQAHRPTAFYWQVKLPYIAQKICMWWKYMVWGRTWQYEPGRTAGPEESPVVHAGFILLCVRDTVEDLVLVSKASIQYFSSLSAIPVDGTQCCRDLNMENWPQSSRVVMEKKRNFKFSVELEMYVAQWIECFLLFQNIIVFVSQHQRYEAHNSYNSSSKRSNTHLLTSSDTTHKCHMYTCARAYTHTRKNAF